MKMFNARAVLTTFASFAILLYIYVNINSTYWSPESLIDENNEKASEEKAKKIESVALPESVVEIEKKPNAKMEQLKAIWNYIYEKKYICSDEVYLGGKMGVDGAYYLCKDKKFWPFPNPGADRCLVYSFGIDYDYKFDDAIANMGCEVHAFDPSMTTVDGTVQKSGVVFHKIGIAEKDNDNGYKGWKMRTLKTLMKELGHQNRVLDYLKVDTDKSYGFGFEDVIMKELLDTGLYQCVRQYAMEIHLGGALANDANMNRCKTIYQQMVDLQKGGWLLYQNVDNVRARQFYHPKDTQETVKNAQFAGKGDAVLWETHFVNSDLKGKCAEYLV